MQKQNKYSAPNNFFQNNQKPREVVNKTLKNEDIFTFQENFKKSRENNNTKSSVFTFQSEVQVKQENKNQIKNKTLLNTYKFGEKVNDDKKIRSNNNQKSSIFDFGEKEKRISSKNNNNFNSTHFCKTEQDETESVNNFKKNDYQKYATNHLNNANNSFNKRLEQVYGQSQPNAHYQSQKSLQTLQDFNSTSTKNNCNPMQKKVKDYYCKNLITEEDKNQLYDNCSVITQTNQNQQTNKISDNKNYHFQKKYQDLFSSDITNCKNKQQSQNVNNLQKSKQQWADQENQVKRTKDQQYSNLFGKESGGYVRKIDFTSNQPVNKVNWNESSQKNIDNTGKKFTSAFNKKQMEMKSSSFMFGYENYNTQTNNRMSLKL